ncbi:MAG: hypothetical protein K6A15_00985 [Treponema sp.]|nr:hypothetical protein [Treponema sp.]
MDSTNEIVKGRKTFFIAPDEILLSPDFLEEYLAKDYECYFIKNDLNNSITTKVETILSLFSDAIIFLNIDHHIENEGTDWPHFITKLSKAFPNACIGIMYEKRKTLAEKNVIEKFYLYDLCIKGGCVQLEFQKYRNFVLIEKVLYANQAMGRRKTVRAICHNNNCYINYEDKDGKVLYLPLNDISLSHFSLTIDDDVETPLQDTEKLLNLSFIIKGMRFIANAILFTKRKLEGATLYVFAFFNNGGKIGLDNALNKLLIQKMYEILYDNCSTLLLTSYKNYRSRKEQAPFIIKKDISFDENLSEQSIN